MQPKRFLNLLWTIVADRGVVLRTAADLAVFMLVFETHHPMEARRARRALFRAAIASLNLSGQSVTGIVSSVMEDRSEGPSKWIIKVEPKEQVARYSRRRYNPYGEQTRYG